MRLRAIVAIVGLFALSFALPTSVSAAPIYRCRPAILPQTVKLTERHTNCNVARAVERYVYRSFDSSVPHANVLDPAFHPDGGCPRYGDSDLPNTWGLSGFCWFAEAVAVSGGTRVDATGVNLAGTVLADVWITSAL